MIVYRIARRRSRSNDLSGQGAANEGGRWNSQGIHALYTSESRALALLEILVHADYEDLPGNLFVMVIEIEGKAIYEVKDTELPINWRETDNLKVRAIGDQILNSESFVAFKVRSAILPAEYNVILNPKFADFTTHVKVLSVEDLALDQRLI